jgi:outer membrane protein Omp28
MNALYIFIVGFLVLVGSAIGQDFVSTETQLRNVVLEEFTGIHCGNCPSGHKKAKALAAEYPGRVVLLSIHEGSYAVPRAGEPDFRTQFGPAILSQSSVTAFPCATINRMVFPGEGEFPYWIQRRNGMAMSVNGWSPAAKDSVLNGSVSPLNIAAKARWDNNSRLLEVDVEVYFTDDVPNDVKLNIALLESHVWGPQTGASNPNHYEHNHIFRDYLTGQWGETISETSLGSLFKKTFTYSVGNEFEITNCDLALFATDNLNRNIYTGIELQVISPNASFVSKGGGIINTLSSATKDNIIELENLSEHEITFNIALTQSDLTPMEWSATIENGNDVTIAPGAKGEKVFRVSANGKHGVGDYYFTISEAGNPVSNSVFDSIRVVTTDITHLEVDAGGSILNDIQDARANAIALPYGVFHDLRPRFNELQTVVWNTGKTGGLDSVQAMAIQEMLGQGINILLSGSGGIPLLALNYPTHSLLAKLGINWSQMNELPFTDFSLVGIVNDPVSNGFSAEGLSIANNGYMMQKIDITNPANTFPMIKMVETGDAVSVRTQNSSARSIYLGFNPIIIEDDAIRTDLITKSLDWLEGVTSVDRPGEIDHSVEISASIIPQSAQLVINIIAEKSYNNTNLSVYDIRGVMVQKVWEGRMDAHGTDIVTTFNHPRGIYFVRFVSDDQQLTVPIVN